MSKGKKHITRRDFVRGGVMAALGTSLLGGRVVKGIENRSRSSSLVVVERGNTVLDTDGNVNVEVLRKMVDTVVTRMTGKKTPKDAWLSLVSPQDMIGLVPTSHLNPTHPELIDGVKEALVAAGVPKKRITLAQGSPEKAKAVTALISLPGLKAHWLTGIGTVFKNYIMYSGKPSHYHGEDNAALGEIWLLPHVKGKTKLVLVDALVPLCDKGPQPDPRYKWAYKGLIAGIDPVAVETVCLRILNEKRRRLRGEPWPLSPPPLCVEAADKIYGLGTSSMKKIEVQRLGWRQDGLL